MSFSLTRWEGGKDMSRQEEQDKQMLGPCPVNDFLELFL